MLSLFIFSLRGKGGNKMENLRFEESEGKIEVEEYLETINFLDRNLVMGIELERNCNNNSIMDVSRLLNTSTTSSNIYNAYRNAVNNPFNVAFVSSDGTVRGGGNEIIFNGTGESFIWIKNRLEAIEKKLDSIGSPNYCASTSNHITAITLQNKLLHEVILKNIINISRAFATGIAWLGSGDPNDITRRGGFSSYCQPRLHINPLRKSFSTLRNLGTKYSMCNFVKQTGIMIGEDYKLNGLTVEWRSPDGIRAPSALTSLTFLFRAIVYKAVELSTKGLLSVESVGDWRENKSMMEIFRDTSFSKKQLFRDRPEHKEFCVAQSKKLIKFLTPVLKKMSPESIEILNKMAQEPISYRQTRWGKNWKTTDKELFNPKPVKFSENEKFILGKAIDQSIKETSSTKWKKKVSEELNISPRMVEIILAKLQSKHNLKIVFDREIQSYMVM